MSPASTFATHFARLIAQRIHEPANVDAHRAALAGALAANQVDVTIAWDNWRLRSGEDTLSASSPPLLDLLTRMAAHGVRELSFGAGTERAHLLGVAWIFCQEPTLGDGGAHALSRFESIGAPGVRMVTVVAPKVEEAELPTPTAQPSIAPPLETEVAQRPHREPTFLTARRPERETADVLIAHLAAAQTHDQIARALDALAAFTELPHRAVGDMAAILTALVSQEPRFATEDAQRMFGFAARRIAKSSTFRSMAGALQTMPERRDEFVRIFRHFGDVAADQVIEQLANADAMPERRLLFDILVELHRGVPTLISLLGDGRWYVARNSAELLGEMRALESEQPLAGLLKHRDARVRRSATVALVRLDTMGARAAVREAANDASPDVRMTAMLGLAYGDKHRVAAQIIRALPDERDPKTQQTLMLVLARLGTPEAIQYLLNAAEPERSLFRKKSTPKRVAAVAALADASDPTALHAIRAMMKDKEPEVRDAAARALTPAKARAAATPPEVRW